jgi:hypothetical protein
MPTDVEFLGGTLKSPCLTNPLVIKMCTKIQNQKGKERKSRTNQHFLNLVEKTVL